MSVADRRRAVLAALGSGPSAVPSARNPRSAVVAALGGLPPAVPVSAPPSSRPQPRMQQAALFDEAPTRTDLERFLGSCPNCGVTVRVGAVETGPRAWQIVDGPRALLKTVKSDGQSITVGCPHCHGAKVRLELVEALHTEEPCNAACMFARGPRCECSCGGENHGAGFGLMFERLGWLDMAKTEPPKDADHG